MQIGDRDILQNQLVAIAEVDVDVAVDVRRQREHVDKAADFRVSKQNPVRRTLPGAKIENSVSTETGHKDKQVIAAAADQFVVTGPARQRVIALAANQQVVPLAAVDLIIAASAIDQIISGATINDIVSLAGQDKVVAVAGCDSIVAFSSNNQVGIAGAVEGIIATRAKDYTH